MHKHGGHPEYDFERLGIESRPVIDFSVNISPLGVPEPIKKIWDSLLSENEQYPSMEGDGVKRFYEQRFGLSPDCVLPGNGSIDLIYDVPRILGVKRALVSQPEFHDYARACRAIGAEVIDGQLDKLEGCNAHFIGNPNNPSGKLIPADILLQLADNFPEVLFFVDEAFIQFVKDAAPYTLMRPDRLRDNIVIFHSLTKIYALPGLRIGACISTPRTIAKLSACRAPWMVSRISERVAEALIRCSDYEQKLVPMIGTERARMFKALDEHPAFLPTPGAANYLLIQWKGSDNLDDLLKHLLERGLYVRDCRNFPTLEKNWFRLAIRLPEENILLLRAIEEL
jgi:threonine-phosphate decarboxylase